MTNPAKPSDRAPADDQLVVATPHVPYVLAELQGLGMHHTKEDSSEELGLVLLQLPHRELDRAASPRLEADVEATALDLFLRDKLYPAFERKYGGWVPTMGKNRVLDRIGAAHNIGGGGEARPEPATGGLPPRDDDPGAQVRVGVADTALREHPWLSGAYQVAPSGLWHHNGTAPNSAAGHATFVAGLVLQQVPGATVEVRRVLDDAGHAESWALAKELVRFSRSRIDVLNLSFGCETDDNKSPLVLARALERLDPDVVVVAAAGNHGKPDKKPRPMWPAAFDQVVAVGAVKSDGELPAWSPDPRELPWVDVVAPGVDLRSTYLAGRVRVDREDEEFEEFDEGFATWSGTSFAAAQVSGAIASRVVPGRLRAATVLRELLDHPPRWWQNMVPWLP